MIRKGNNRGTPPTAETGEVERFCRFCSTNFSLKSLWDKTPLNRFEVERTSGSPPRRQPPHHHSDDEDAASRRDPRRRRAYHRRETAERREQQRYGSGGGGGGGREFHQQRSSDSQPEEQVEGEEKQYCRGRKTPFFAFFFAGLRVLALVPQEPAGPQALPGHRLQRIGKENTTETISQHIANPSIFSLLPAGVHDVRSHLHRA